MNEFPTEDAFKKQVIYPFLKEKGWYWFPAELAYGRKGIADIIVSVCGSFVAIEASRSRKEALTAPRKALQLREAEQVVTKGGVSLFCFPENWEKTKQTLIAVEFWANQNLLPMNVHLMHSAGNGVGYSFVSARDKVLDIIFSGDSESIDYILTGKKK